MTDSMDEWDGGAIDGRDQYLGDAPYWSNGDGETIGATDSDEGEITTENAPGPEALREADDTDESETESGEVPTWPPNPETVAEIRRRLLNGSGTKSVADWAPTNHGSIYDAATGESFAAVGADADIPALKTVGNGPGAEWVIDEGGETQSESTDDDWPPTPDELDDIRRRLVAGESAAEIAEEYPVCRTTMDNLAKAETYPESEAIQNASTPPVESPGSIGRNDWVWAEPVDLETETTDNDDAEQETEATDSEEPQETDRRESGLVTEWIADEDSADEPDPEPKTETTETAETEEESGPEPDQQDSGLVSGNERPVARDPPEPETPTVPTRWLVAGVAFIAGWILSRLVRGGED